MALRWYSVVIDCRDIAAQARWWQEVLDWTIVYEDEHEVAVIPRHASIDPVEAADWHRQPQGLVFVPVPEGKTVKNRLHLDLAPHTSQDRDAEIARLLEMGATKVDVGQSDDVTWTVLADPEGNEFCVLSSRDR
jgi:predicted enzyme related to lactoylglutathione lyase